MSQHRKQTTGEEIANAVSHGIMGLFGLIALILLLIESTTIREYAGAILFGGSIMLLYIMSTLYHSLTNKKAKSVFKRMDHISIYVLIGGTFAPALLLIPQLQEPFIGQMSLGVFMLTIQWILIIIGTVFKAIWIKRFSTIHVIIYLLMGWSSLIFVGALLSYSPSAFVFVLLGGIAYSLGVIFYALSKYKYFHFIWHLWTSLATILQFIAIYGYLY
ncbi:MAG: hemolysin III family protein [Firmicutes bacterium]|nr:hemolysin III family protein [Bacillota bacterium]